MNLLDRLFNPLKEHADKLQNLPANPFFQVPVMTEAIVDRLVSVFEKTFKDAVPLGEIPEWAKPLQPILIDWHQAVSAEDASAIDAALNQSSYKDLYLQSEAPLLLQNGWETWISHLSLIARVLTVMAEGNCFVIRIRPEWFVFYHDHIYCNWKTLEKAAIRPEQTIIDTYEPGWMHPTLRKREVPKEFPMIAAVNHAFVYLILYTLTRLPPPSSYEDLEIQIDRFRVFNPQLSPLLRPFFRSWLLAESATSSKNPMICCQEFEILIKEIHVRHQTPYIAGHSEFKSDSAFGRNKKNNENEDCIVFLKGIPNSYVLAGIADGVSTATIGTGWLASNTVKRQFQLYEKQWGKAISEFPDPAEHPEKWAVAAEQFLNQIFQTAHAAIVEEINRIIENCEPTDSDSTMSSTLVLALVIGNQGIIAHWGDSRAYLITQSAVIRLTEDHNNLLTELAKSRNKTKSYRIQREGSSHLIRTVGACVYNKESGRFVPVPAEKQPIAISRCVLNVGEFLLLCSDGLLSGLSESSEREKEDRILGIFAQYGSKGCREITRQLVRTADDDRGDDNISALVLNFKSKIGKE